MTALRIAAWLLGAALIAWTGLQVERVFFFADSYDGLLSLRVAGALALLTMAAVVRFRRLRAAPALLALAWLVPYVAGIPQLSSSSRTLADATSWALPGLTVLTLLGSQGGRSPWRSAAALALAGSGLAIAVRILLVDPFLDLGCWPVCLPNPYALQSGGDAASGLFAIAVLLIVAGLVESIRRVWQRTSLDRWAEAAAVPCTVASILLALADPRPGTIAMTMLTAVACLAAMALSGALVAREAGERSLQRRLTDLAIDLAAGPSHRKVGPAMAELLGDPALTIRYWDSEGSRFLDDTGSPAEDPRLGTGQPCTTVTRDGQLVAAIAHARPTGADQVGRALGPALQLALENERLGAITTAELHELEASRQRILERGSQERRSLERNLHDGAQQRVVSLFFLLRALASHVPRGGELLVEQASARTRDLLEELRRIGRGIHPAVVGDAGLVDALTDLAGTSSRPVVTVSGQPAKGLPRLADVTVYEVLATALADARNGSATRFDVRFEPVRAGLRIEVVHDSAGPSPAAAVDGRVPFVEALSGRLDVSGIPGAWRIGMELPCES